MQGNPAAVNVKWGLRALSVVLVPLTASFSQVCGARCTVHTCHVVTRAPSLSQGVFIYWITSNTFSFVQTLGAYDCLYARVRADKRVAL